MPRKRFLSVLAAGIACGIGLYVLGKKEDVEKKEILREYLEDKYGKKFEIHRSFFRIFNYFFLSIVTLFSRNFKIIVYVFDYQQYGYFSKRIQMNQNNNSIWLSI